MKILVISDIHANLTALQAVLDAAGKVDATWCLGDLVGYGPDPNECIELIHALPNLTCLIGNHDAAALGQIDTAFFNREAQVSSRWMRSKLSAKNIEFLKSLPDLKVINQITITHGSPRNPVWEYILDTQTAAINFTYFKTQLCFVGHTHLPVAYIEKDDTKEVELIRTLHGQSYHLTNRAILNPGSVGQPRDRDNRASFAIYETEKNTWKQQRISYDIQSVQTRIANAGLPQRHAQRLAEGW
jgi:predicted phosphodiesterase